MTPEELRAELDTGKVRSAYLIAGGEPLYRDDALLALRAAVLASGPSDFNFERLESDAKPAALIDSVRTLPVMAPHRLVVLRNPEGARGGGAGAHRRTLRAREGGRVGRSTRGVDGAGCDLSQGRQA